MSDFQVKQWVRFYRAFDIFVAGIEIPVGTIAQIIEVDEDGGLWVRPAKRFRELDEFLNGVQLWDWRIANKNPDDEHPGTYVVPADCPFD